ncbi:hypothetical protein EMMF5_000917 [Cystobasidiomycetes sp. EMM_F5]
MRLTTTSVVAVTCLAAVVLAAPKGVHIDKKVGDLVYTDPLDVDKSTSTDDLVLSKLDHNDDLLSDDPTLHLLDLGEAVTYLGHKSSDDGFEHVYDSSSEDTEDEAPIDLSTQGDVQILNVDTSKSLLSGRAIAPELDDKRAPVDGKMYRLIAQDMSARARGAHPKHFPRTSDMDTADCNHDDSSESASPSDDASLQAVRTYRKDLRQATRTEIVERQRRPRNVGGPSPSAVFR